jgi:hypothetical protein
MPLASNVSYNMAECITKIPETNDLKIGKDVQTILERLKKLEDLVQGR